MSIWSAVPRRVAPAFCSHCASVAPSLKLGVHRSHAGGDLLPRSTWSSSQPPGTANRRASRDRATHSCNGWQRRGRRHSRSSAGWLRRLRLPGRSGFPGRETSPCRSRSWCVELLISVDLRGRGRIDLRSGRSAALVKMDVPSRIDGAVVVGKLRIGECPYRAARTPARPLNRWRWRSWGCRPGVWSAGMWRASPVSGTAATVSLNCRRHLPAWMTRVYVAFTGTCRSA